MTKPTPEQACWVIKQLYEAMHGGYTMGGLIENLMEYPAGHYSEFMDAGLLSIMNDSAFLQELMELVSQLKVEGDDETKARIEKFYEQQIATL